MVSLATDKDKLVVRQLWERCFNDSPAFVDLYFSQKYRSENTLIYHEAGKALASLQLLPYQFTFYGVEVPVGYISGACTLPEYRNKGYMRLLLLSAFELMQQRGILLSLLIPAEEWLYDYYAKFGYAKVFERGNKAVDLKKIMQQADGDFALAYAKFDAFFRKKDFCVQKTKEDFFTIVKTAELDEFPQQKNLSGMARVIDAEALLSIFARRNTNADFSFILEDNFLKENDGLYVLKNATLKKEKTDDSLLQRLDVAALCRLLLGVSLKNEKEDFRRYFSSQTPTMNFMLE